VGQAAARYAAEAALKATQDMLREEEEQRRLARIAADPCSHSGALGMGVARGRVAVLPRAVGAETLGEGEAMIEDDAALGPLLALFQSEVHDRADRVDPTNEQDWFSVTLGWAIAKGLTPESAHDFAIHVRYKTNLA